MKFAKINCFPYLATDYSMRDTVIPVSTSEWTVSYLESLEVRFENVSFDALFNVPLSTHFYRNVDTDQLTSLDLSTRVKLHNTRYMCREWSNRDNVSCAEGQKLYRIVAYFYRSSACGRNVGSL